MAQRSTSRFNRRALLWMLLAAGLLLIAAVIVVITLLGAGALQSRVEATAADQLGVEASISGPVRLALWPTPILTVADMGLDRDGMRVAGVDALRLHVALVPLLLGELRIRHLDIEGADIEITRDAGVRIHGSGCGGRLSNMRLRDPDQHGLFAALQAEGTLHCAAVDAGDFRLTDLELELSARNGLLQLEPIALLLFDGNGSGQLTGDFSGDLPVWSMRLELDSFSLEQFLQALDPEARAEGRMSLLAELSASGDSQQALDQSLNGTIVLSGTQLTLHGTDLDRRLEDYEAAQTFGLLDAGALFFAGPLGLIVTRGRGFAPLLRSNEGRTVFRQMVSEWTVVAGVAEAVDVAAASEKNRLAARGRINYADRGFDDFTIMVLDSQGCALMEQAVQGSFEEPQIEEPGAVVTLLGPLIDLVEKGFSQLAGEDCEVVYDGEITHPGQAMR